jgi:hypothetical protein
MRAKDRLSLVVALCSLSCVGPKTGTVKGTDAAPDPDSTAETTDGTEPGRTPTVPRGREGGADQPADGPLASLDGPAISPDAGRDVAPTSPPDAAATPLRDAAGSELAADTASPPPLPDAAPDLRPTPAANRAFITSKLYPSNLGGLAGADARCQESAQAAGMEGKFLALLSTSTVPAFSRLGSSRGWVRTDGTPFGDTQADLLNGKIYYPLSLDEYGREYTGGYYAFTGTNFGGAASAGMTANDWTATADACRVTTGYAIDGKSWYWGDDEPCNFDNHLFCLEVGRSAVVAPPTPPAGARIAFRSKAVWNPSSGLPSADALCASDAKAAALPGSFAAFLATSKASAVSRFDLGGGPWVRTDGVALVAKATDLAAGKVVAPLMLGADGQLPMGVYDVWTGSTSPSQPGTDTCRDWSSNDGALLGNTGAPAFSGVDWFSNGRRYCNSTSFTGVYCFQK